MKKIAKNPIVLVLLAQVLVWAAMLAGPVLGSGFSNTGPGNKAYGSIATKTANYTATATDFIILCNPTGNITITLPAASSSTNQIYIIKKIDSDADTVTIDGNASETIDGATTLVIASQYTSYTLVCDGSNWHVY